MAFFANDLDYVDESASCKEDGPAQQHFLQMIRIVWMVQPVAKSIFGTTTFFLAHRTKLVGCVRTAEEG